MKLKKLMLAMMSLIMLTNCQQSIPIKQVHTKEAEILLPKILDAVKYNHYKPRTLDKSLSEDMFTYFMEALDPQKEFLTQKDFDYLSAYKFTLDTAILNNNFEFFNSAYTLLDLGIIKAENYSNQWLDQSLDFSIKEQLNINFSQLPYVKNDQALKERWRKKIRKYTLDQLMIVEKRNPSISTEDLLAKAKEKVRKLLELKINKLKSLEADKKIEAYVNAFLKVQDNQTEYLSPKQKSIWDDKFTRSFVGIGARIILENGYPKIERPLIGGPIWKAKSMEANDMVLKLKEKDGVAVDLFGKPLEEVISLLKGERGSSVFLTIKDRNAQIKEVEIIRDKIDSDLAMSFILEDNSSKQKIGYIRLPRFYAGDPGCAAHVLTEMEILKSNKVDGIVFDVRNNQGGSGGECRTLLDYFLEDGLFMQTKRAGEEVNQYYGNTPSAQYNGKLLVLTNSRSGSASELFSGTLQDYNRAVIVGAESTYGKGTMQNFIDLNEPESNPSKFGEIKMTVGLFYTASGRTPQSTGIIPDIVLTDDTKYVKSGERTNPFPLARDTVEIIPVQQKINIVGNIDELKNKSEQRIKTNNRFQLADKKARHLAALEKNNLIELNLENYKVQKDRTTNLEKEWETIFSENKDLKVSFDKTAFSQDSASIIKRERLIHQINSDPYIYECYKIINDMNG